MRRTAISDLKQRRHFKRASLWKIRKVLYLIVGKPCWSPATSWRRAIWTTMRGVESKDVTKTEAANPIWRGKKEAFGYLTISWIADVKCEFTFLLHISNMKWKEQVKVITQTLDPIRKEYKNYENYCPKEMTTFIIVFVYLPMGTPRSLCLIGASVSCHVHHRNLAPGSKSWACNPFAFKINNSTWFRARNLKVAPPQVKKWKG